MDKHFSKVHLMPLHGGGLNQAIKKYGSKNNLLNKEQWLDLSTGINPHGWPVPTIPADYYNRLPENDDGLIEAAQSYYQCAHVLAVAGSQEAIQLLPKLFAEHYFQDKKTSSIPNVGIISPCYAEHEFQWQKTKFNILHLSSNDVDNVIDTLDILIIINPNNPTGESIHNDQIKHWQKKLQVHQGFLIIDEAFMDSTPEKSILSADTSYTLESNDTLEKSDTSDFPDNLIVLRSIGKFFGLAGVRCGFVIASQEIISLLAYHQGPWSVSGPTRWLVRQALQDQVWIETTKNELLIASQRLESLLKKYLIANQEQRTITGTVLFKTLFLETTMQSILIYKQLAQQGVLVRLLDNNSGLRFGLPQHEKHWQHLELVLKKQLYQTMGLSS